MTKLRAKLGSLHADLTPPNVHSVYINIVAHYALTSVLISKSLAELAAEDPKLGGVLLSTKHTLYLSFLGPINPSLSSPKFGSSL